MDEEFMKYTIAPIIGVLFFLLFFSGCATNQEKGKNEPLYYEELLHYEDYHATKNIDIKEIIKKDVC